MTQNLHAPGSCDLVTELYELTRTRKTAVYPGLFMTPPEIATVVQALSLAGTQITAILYDEKLSPHVPDLNAKLRQEHYQFVDLAAIRQFQDTAPDTEIILLLHHPVDPGIIMQAGIRCRLYYFFDIPHSVTIEGQLRVLNDVEYLRSWPPVLQQLNAPHMTPAEIGRFMHGKYPYNNTSKGTYFCLENHRSILTSIYNGYIDCGEYVPAGGVKKTVTFLGDSRFFNPTMPSRLHIPSMLQQKFTDAKINCEVRSFCALSNSLQNMLAQLRAMDIGRDDIVLCGSQMRGTYFKFGSILPIAEHGEDSDEILRAKFLLIREMQQYCDERGAALLFLYLPAIQEMADMTPLEQQIAASYGLKHTPNRSHRRLMRLCAASGIQFLDFSEVLMNTGRISHYTDERHFSFDAQRLIADELFDYVNGLLLRDTPAYNDRDFLEAAIEVHQRFVQKILTAHLDESEEYVDYLRALAAEHPGTAGFILMNCNPFTFGHQYLVDTARKQVDHLYVMVVPEENPHFAYKDRLEIAKRACAQYDNVIFLKAPTVYATRALFPEYFERDKNQDTVVDLSKDLYTFCYQIAPALHVTKRFVGPEPFDPVTLQPTGQSRKALPDAGIEFIEIPRKEVNERPVSASDVRRLLQEKQYDEIRRLVPETTYSYLRNELGL